MDASTPPALGSIRVLDLASVGPAARCSRILADYGATVIKLGPTPRKGGVQIEPPYWAYAGGRGMKKVRIDLKAKEGHEAFLRLAEGADVLIESFRPGVAARLGVGYEDLRTLNPRLVYCSTSGYGQSGPRAGWAGHDLNYLAVGGYLDCSGRRADGGPALPGASLADGAGGGMHAAIAILAALVRRGASGQGEYLDVAVADGVLALTSLWVDQYLATGESPGPGHDLLTGAFACYEFYPCRDGRWLSVAAIEPAFWANLCRALELERWIPHQSDADRQEAIRADLRAAFARRDRDDWVAELAPADTCVAPVQSIAELCEDPQFRQRGAFVTAKHPKQGRFDQLGPVLAGAPPCADETELRDAAATDTEPLLREAGLSAAQIEALLEQGVVA